MKKASARPKKPAAPSKATGTARANPTKPRRVSEPGSKRLTRIGAADAKKVSRKRSSPEARAAELERSSQQPQELLAQEAESEAYYSSSEDEAMGHPTAYPDPQLHSSPSQQQQQQQLIARTVEQIEQMQQLGVFAPSMEPSALLAARLEPPSTVHSPSVLRAGDSNNVTPQVVVVPSPEPRESSPFELRYFEGVSDESLKRVLSAEGRIGRIRQSDFVRIMLQLIPSLVPPRPCSAAPTE